MSVTYTAPSIPFEEVADPVRSPQEEDGENGFRATRTLQCNWADRLTLASQLLKAYVVSQSGRVFLIGDKYPYRSRAYVKNIRGIQPVGVSSQGGSAGQISWPHARLTVEYGERDFDPSPSGGSSDSALVVAEETFDQSGEFLTLPNKKLYWDSSQNEPVENAEAPGFLVDMIDWTYSFTEKNSSLPAAFKDDIYKVNSVQITSRSLGITFAAEELLYLGPRVRRQIFSDGDVAMNVDLRYRFRRGTWNKFFRSANATPQQIYDDSGAVFKPYETADFKSRHDVSD